MLNVESLSELSWESIRKTPSRRKGSSHSEWLTLGRKKRPFIYVNISLQGIYRILIEASPKEINRLKPVNTAGLIVESQKLRVEYHPEMPWVIVSCGTQAHLPAFTQIVREIASTILQDKTPAIDAVNSVIGKWKSFWGKPPAAILSDEEQLGLVAELDLLGRLIRSRGATSVWLWAGPYGGHDFEGTNLHIEVKATTTKQHSHIINGIGQLESPSNKRLILLSRLAVKDSERGMSLKSAASTIERLLQRTPAECQEFLCRLASARYRREHETAYMQNSYGMLNEMWFSIGKSFPRLSPASIPQNAASRISEVHYRLNFDGLPFLSNPKKLLLKI